jgi:hypothetical protein
LLPLRWVAQTDDQNHSFWLPNGLKDEADDVLRALEKSDPNSDRYWRLHPCFADKKKDPRESLDSRLGLLSERFNFRKFQAETWKSCWASLAAGLLVAMRGGTVKPQVWASAQWKGDKNQFDAVNGETLEQKLGLAVEWGAEMFFLHDSRKHDSNKEKAEGIRERRGWKLEIRALGLAQREPADAGIPPAETALKPLMDKLEIPPAPHDPLPRRSRHFLFFPHHAKAKADEYYYKNIIDDIAVDCRDKLTKKVGASILTRPRLITILSKSPATLLGAMTVQPRECLVLYTKGDREIEESRDEIQKLFRKNLRELDPHPDALQFESFHKEVDFRTQFTNLIADFISGREDIPLILDLTPGTRLMSINLMTCAPPKTSWFLVIASETSSERGRVIPETADPYLLRKD